MSDPISAPLARALPFSNPVSYDLLARIPVVTFFALCSFAGGQRLLAEAGGVQQFTLAATVQLLAHAAGFAFVLMVALAMLFRLPPVARRGGVFPRLAAIGGAFSLMVLALLPRTEMSPATSVLSLSLIILGNGLACYALLHLGRALSIMPEARRLVTTGPYALVRHPLYAAEAVASLGFLLQYASVPALLVWLVHIRLQVYRMHYEEQILQQAFPEYGPYAERHARILPGVF